MFFLLQQLARRSSWGKKSGGREQCHPLELRPLIIPSLTTCGGGGVALSSGGGALSGNCASDGGYGSARNGSDAPNGGKVVWGDDVYASSGGGGSLDGAGVGYASCGWRFP